MLYVRNFNNFYNMLVLNFLLLIGYLSINYKGYKLLGMYVIFVFEKWIE